MSFAPLLRRGVVGAVLLGCCLVSTIAHGAEPSPRLSDAQRSELLQQLRQAMREQRGPVRLQAAEALIWHGYPEDVAAAFQDEIDTAQPPYRIDVWRLMAQTTNDPAVRQQFLDRIRQAAADEDATDREFAADTLATLEDRSAQGLRPAAQRTAEDEAEAAQLKGRMNEYAAGVAADDRYKAAQFLAEYGTMDDVGLLHGLVDDADPRVSVAAANALLRIDRRVPHHMGRWDWLVIAGYMTGMLLIGWYYARQVVTTDDYMLGGRNMKSWAVGLSLFATLLSTISYLSWPGEIIMHGPMFLCSLLAYPFIMWVVGWFLIPFFMKLKVTSAYEILELRLGLSVRMLGAGLFLLLRLLWMAVIIYATVTQVLIPLTGLSPAATPWICALMGVVTIIYTALGGLRAVVVTDVLQTGILFGGAVLTMVVITVNMGGVDAWWPTEWAPNWQEPKLGYDPNVRITLIGAMIATFTWFVCTAGSDQMAIQRYLATRDARAARRMFGISLGMGALTQGFLAVLGFALLGYFRDHRHIFSDGQSIMTHADQLFPQFIVFGLPEGISGLVVAGLLAAAMSSLSSGLNSSCSVLTVDFIDRFRRNRTSDSDHVRLARYISVLVGVVVVLLSSVVGAVSGNLLEVAYKVVNLLTAPLFGLFFMAMFVRRATSFGTIVGAVVGLAVVTAINYWQEITGTRGISFLWAMPLSFMAQIAVGMAASLLPIGRRPTIAPTDLLADE